ncbi:MAG: putative NAD(P)-binding, partial [Deltaproteobacteria bacterium]|nr:putative NAD(P)-binding [Deltaproteobacteria bacterium]
MKEGKTYLPVFFDVTGARALVVGAGPVAARKIDALLAGGATVTVAAKEFVPAVLKREAAGELAA